MKLLILLFLLKLFARINVFKFMPEKYGQSTIKLAKIIKKQHTKLSRLKSDIDYLLQCKRHNLGPKRAIQISNFLRNKALKQILEADLKTNIGKRKCYSDKLIIIETT